MKLEIEPIPMSSWGLSLANKLDKKEWDKIRHKVYEESNYQCNLCGASGVTLHCHEVWHYDFRKRVQSLKGFKCVCETCHNVIHFGRSSELLSRTHISSLVTHWCKVNKKTLRDFQVHSHKIHQESLRRTKIFWIVKVGRRIIT